MVDIFAGEHKEELFEKIRQMPEGLLDKAKKLKPSPATTNNTPESVAVWAKGAQDQRGDSEKWEARLHDIQAPF